MPAVVRPWEMLRIPAGEMGPKRGARLQTHDSSLVSAQASMLSMRSLANSAVDQERAVKFIYGAATLLPSMPAYVLESWKRRLGLENTGSFTKLLYDHG